MKKSKAISGKYYSSLNTFSNVDKNLIFGDKIPDFSGDGHFLRTNSVVDYNNNEHIFNVVLINCNFTLK